MQFAKLRPYASACLWMVAGSAAVFGSVLMINKLSQAPEREPASARSEILVQKLPEPPPQQVVQKPKPPEPPKNITPPANPLKGLDSALAGIDVGMPALAMGDLDGAAGALLGDGRDVTMTSDTVDQAPQPLRQVAMAYPAKARAKGVEGYVLLSILVDAEGRIERVKVLESSPGGTFDEVALQGIRRWEFKPAEYQGQRVKAWVRQRINFNLS